MKEKKRDHSGNRKVWPGSAGPRDHARRDDHGHIGDRIVTAKKPYRFYGCVTAAKAGKDGSALVFTRDSGVGEAP